jgi:hypothetical protein
MPCGQCKVDLVKKLAAHPPDYSSPWAWFVWTVWLHNDVLARQGRRQWSLAEAAARWGKAQPPSNAG